MSERAVRAVSVSLHFCLARFVMRQFDQHSAKWARRCKERGLSKEAAMVWLNEAGQ